MKTTREKFEKLTIDCSVEDAKNHWTQLQNDRWEIVHTCLKDGDIFHIVAVRPL